MPQKYRYKVVVVEDEPLILKNVIQKIQSINPVYKVEGFAHNGKDAIPVIDSVKPDILFTDIRMPIMDGLELISRVREKYPDMQIVIISGYNEFDYARQAIKLGVKEYLLKPLKLDSLEETLNNIKSKLEADIFIIERNILSSDINGRPVTDSLPYSLKEAGFTLFLVCIGHLCNHITSGSQLKLFNDLWSRVRWNDITPALLHQNDKYWVVDEKQPNQKFIIVSWQAAENIDIVSIARQLKDKLVELFAPLPVSVCTEGTIIPYTEIWTMAQKLRLLLDQGLIIGKSDIITPKELKNLEQLPSALDTATQSKISTLLLQGNKKLLQQELYALFNKWVQAQYPQRWAEKALHQLIKLFHCQTVSISDAEIYHLEYMLGEKLALSPDFSSMYGDIWNIFDNMLQSECKETDDTRELVDRVEDYLKMNFTEVVNLEDISKKFNFNPSYLTRVFKKYKGETPLKYLITLRIEEAKRLIRSQPDLDLKEVGEIIGYSDQHYFSRIFKNITGNTLSDYKEQTIQKLPQKPFLPLQP